MANAIQPNLDALFSEHRESLARSVLRIVGCPHTAEDLVQEAYIRVRQALRKRPILRLRPFLYQTARNLALDHLRKQRLRRTYHIEGADPHALLEVMSNAPSPEERAAEGQRLARLDRILRELPERRRQILLLHRLHGWRYARIAAHFGISASAVEKNVRLALLHCLSAMPTDGDEAL